MDNEQTNPNENRQSWNLLLIVTLLLATIVTVLMLEKERFLPSLYAAQHQGDSHEEEAHASHQPERDEKTDTTSRETQKPEVHRNEDVKPADAGRYLLIAGSFRSEERAKGYQSLLRDKFEAMAPAIKAVRLKDGVFYRVVALRSNNKEQVESLQVKLNSSGYSSWVLEK